jgi:carboxyl-terminal processing protease
MQGAKHIDQTTWDTAVRRIVRTLYDRNRAHAFGARARAAAANVATAGGSYESATLDALIASLGASHTARLTPDTMAYYEALAIYGSTSGALSAARRKLFPPRGIVTYEGVGWRLREIDGRMFASAVYDGGPAWRAGILLGDEVVSIDGATPSEIESFRGKSGQTVTAGLRRVSGQAMTMLDVPVERIEPIAFFASAARDSVRIANRNGYRIGSIRLWAYAGDAFQDLLRDELSHGRLKDVDALVLDLRGGWGGASPEYVSLFAGCIPLMTFIDRTGAEHFASFQWRRPVVIAIDEATRSGKEIFAWALQRAGVPLVGARTPGAVLGAKASILPDSSLLLVAVKDVRVENERLEGRGVEPNVAVPFALPYAAGNDPQMEAALSEAARCCAKNASTSQAGSSS